MARRLGRLGNLLVRNNLLTQEQLDFVLEEQAKTGERLGSICVRMGLIDDETLTKFLSEQYGVPAINLHDVTVDANTLRLISPDLARKYNILPVARRGSSLTVAMADPSNISALDDISFMTGLRVEPVVASETMLRNALDRHYGDAKALATEADLAAIARQATAPAVADEEGGDEFGQEDDEFGGFDEDEEAFGDEDEEFGGFGEEEGDAAGDDLGGGGLGGGGFGVVEAPIVELVDGILQKAIRDRVSDIHFEPFETNVRVRFRVDGVLHAELQLPLEFRQPVTTRLKLLARLDLALKSLPQEGRMRVRLGTGDEQVDVEFRVSTLPVVKGEKIVVRYVDKRSSRLDITKLGFDKRQLAGLVEALRRPYGMVLVAGPMDSGKTTSLYAMMASLNKPSRNLVTVEDPIEFDLEGVNQVAADHAMGLTPPVALRALLRQDVDVIMVSELDDFETAELAIKAAATGHLTLSSLYALDAAAAVTGLLMMGVEPYHLASTINCVVAQRLVRALCPKCKAPGQLSRRAAAAFGLSREAAASLRPYKAVGCAACQNRGYVGRFGLHEVMPMTDTMRDLLINGVTATKLRQAAVSAGMVTLRQRGLERIKDGTTSVDEISRVTFGG